MKFTSPINNNLKLTQVQFDKAFADVSEICKNKFGKEFSVFTEEVTKLKSNGVEYSFTETNTQSIEALTNDKKQILKKQVDFLNPAIYK